MLDLVIVGAGPAGLSCALAAHNHHLDYQILEKGNIVNAIINFPVNMTFFSTADQLEIGGIPFTSAGFRPTRQEVVKYYHNLATHFGFEVRPDFCVDRIERKNGHFEISAVHRDKSHKIESRKVVLATGFYDNPNRINVPGEEQGHVSHYYHEAFPFFGRNVVIVGAKNSAVEAALELFRNGAHVTMIHRRPEIKDSVKYWILPDMLNRIKEGSIKAYFNAEVTRIMPGRVEIIQNGTDLEIPADAVFLLTGYHPDTGLFDSAGIQYDPESLEPEIDLKTHETNVPGLYIAGSLVAGKNHNRVFIENSREHGEKIVQDIVSNPY